MGLQPKQFQVGDRVFDRDRPKWGSGLVVEAGPLGEIRFLDGMAVNLRPSGPTQRLVIEFEHRGRVTVVSSDRPLTRCSRSDPIEEWGPLLD